MASLLAGEYNPGQDLTLEIAKNLAFAWLAFERLKESGEDLTIERRELIGPQLIKAWRETLESRRRISPEKIDDTLLSRYGRIYAPNPSPSSFKGVDGDS
jgi:hypothetical protein